MTTCRRRPVADKHLSIRLSSDLLEAVDLLRHRYETLGVPGLAAPSWSRSDLLRLLIAAGLIQAEDALEAAGR